MDSNAPAVAEGKDDRVSGKKHRLKGMKIRDEFICPITYELMKDPAIALDGHTYERIAIEKWLKSHNTSPRTGEPMQSILIPNLNMKKLIQDLIDEVGDRSAMVHSGLEHVLCGVPVAPTDDNHTIHPTGM